MTGLVGAEGVAATERIGASSRTVSGETPEQSWGSAAGRSHGAASGATSAGSGGGRDGHKPGAGELPPEPDASPALLVRPGTPQVETAPAAPVVERPRGFDPKSSREIVTDRAPMSRTFRNADGTQTTKFFEDPVNYRRADGEWRSIDTSLKPVGQGGHLGRAATSATGGWSITEGDAATAFAGHADGSPLVSMNVGGTESIGFALRDAAHVPGVVDGSVITYRDVLPSADVQFVAGGDSVKEVLVLKDADAPQEWVFPLHAPGLTAALEPTGAVAFTDVTGKLRARIPAGWMEDANVAPHSNQGEISDGVRFELTEVDGGQALRVKLDTAWLHDPRRAFPVKVDPTVVNVSAVAASSGTYVEAPYNVNFSGDTVLKTGTYDAGGHKAAAFLHFAGVETTLKNAWVLGASLALYNTWSYSCTARPVTVHPVTAGWSESTTSAYPGPATGASLASKSFAHGWRPSGQTAYPCGGAAWEGINLGAAGRQLVDDWTHGRKKNYGLAVKASVTDSYGWKNFGSDDYPNGKPSLDVTWTKYGAGYQLGTFVTPMTATTEGAFKLTVTNRGQEIWPANGNYRLRYRLYDSAGKEITDAAKIRWTAMPSSVAPGAAVTIDAKVAPLVPGTYTIAWTMDDYGTSTFSAAGIPTASVKISTVNIPPAVTGLAPASGTVVDTLTPTLWASGTDRDRYPKALEHQFEVCEVDGADTRKNCRMGPRGASAQWNIPAGWMTWSKTYAWYGYVFDGAALSVRPGPSLLTTQVPQPPITAHLGTSDTGREFGERNGNYATAATDASIPTVGPELSVTRTYNSQDTRTGSAFGTGWATRWDMRAVPESSGSVLITLSNGAQVRFGRNSDGGYAAPSGSMGLLKAGASGGWTLKDASANLYTFDTAGRLTKVSDGHGRSQQLTYTDGRLTAATDVLSGRRITFTWSGGHVVSALTSPVDGAGTSLAWTYTYEGDNLVRVCPPGTTTGCTRYTYESGSQYRNLVLDAGPVGYWRLGETTGETAASEAVSSTGMKEGLYRDVTQGAAGALAGTTNKAGTFSQAHVELPDSILSRSTALSVEMWFRTGRYEGVLLGFQDAPLGDAPGADTRPVLEIDPNGYLVGAFDTVGTSENAMSSGKAVDDNQWHHVALTSNGTSQTLYVDGVSTGTLAGPVDHGGKTYTYLGAGYSNRMWATGEGDRHFAGALDEAAVYHRALDAGTVKEHFAARGGSSRLTEVTLPSGRTDARITYDGTTERVTEVADAAGTWKLSAPTYASGSQGYTSAVRDAGAVDHWRLGDNSGAVARDEIATGTDGSYRNGVTLGEIGAFSVGDDGAIGLDGAEGAVEVQGDALETSAALSVELWFRTDQAEGVLLGLQNTALGTAPQNYNPSLLVDANGKLRGSLWRGAPGAPVISSAAVTDNTWHHVVLTGGTTGQTLYLDGTKVGSMPGAVKPETLAHVYLGAGHATPGWDGSTTSGVKYFEGALDEAAFYAKELSAATVMDHYRARTRLVTGNGDQYRSAVLGDAPAGFWQLDEVTGTQASSTVAANDGTGTYTRTTLGTTGAFGIGDGSAAEFNGDGYVEIPGLGTRTTDVTVEVWFRTAKPGVLVGDQSRTLAGATATSGTWTPVLYVGADGRLHGEYPSPGVTPSNASSVTVTDNAWHHAAITASAGTQSLYLDGTRVAVKTNAPVNQQSNSRTFIGAGFARTWPSPPADVSYFTGQIDEAAVYQHGLTEQQISDHYAARSLAGGSTLASTVTVTDPTGIRTSATYDMVRGQRRVATTDAAGGITRYGYDAGGYLRTVTDPNGHSTVTGHDARGNPVAQTTCRDADSCWTSYEEFYDNPADPLDPRNGKRTATLDARSSGPKDFRYRTTIGYTAQGRPDRLTLPDGRTSATAYTTGSEPAAAGGSTPAGLVAATTTPEGATTTYAYFANGDLARTTAPSGLVTAYAYDGIGRTTSETQRSDTYPDGVVTTFGYDAQSRVVRETGTATKNEITGTTHTTEVRTRYDADGNLLDESEVDLTGGDPARTTTYHYDERGFNDTVTDAEGHVTTYGYDALGQVTSEQDALGNRVVHRLTSRGDLAETVLEGWTGDPSGEPRDLVLESHAYDPAGRLASSTDALGATTRFTYYDDGLPATSTALGVEQSDGTRRDVVLEANTYDGAGYLVKQVTDGGTYTETHTVDATGRVVRTVTDPAGLARTTDYVFDRDDRVTEITEGAATPERVSRRLVYDSAGNVTSSSLVSGTVTLTTRNAYDRRGLLLSSVSPRGTKAGAEASAHTTGFRYDALGRLVEQTAPPVTTETYGSAPQQSRPTIGWGYNAFGDPTDARDETGAVTRTEVDRLGQGTAVTLPSYTPPSGAPVVPVHRATYDALGRRTSVSDPLERTTHYAYDQLGRVVLRTDPQPAAAPNLLAAPGFTGLTGRTETLGGEGTTRYTWTPTGLLLSTTTPTGARTEATYDGLGRQLTATAVERFPSLQHLTTRFAWDDAGNQKAETSPSGLTSTATYNAMGETVTSTDPGGGVTRYGYDALGRQTEVVDPTLRRSTFTHNLLDQVTEATDHGTGTSPLRTFTSTFDEEGNLTAATTPTGGRTTFSHDALGRVTRQAEKLSDTDEIAVGFGYDDRGNLTRFTDGRGVSVHHTFNTWGLPESTVEPATPRHPAEGDRTWTRVYDIAGQVVTDNLPGDVSRHRTYDQLGRLVRETGSGAAAETRPRVLSYDADGRLVGAGTDGFGFGNTYTYNDRGMLLSASGPSGESRYTYDADARMTSRTDAAGSSQYVYDGAGRLDRATDPLTGTQVRFDFDAAGRPVQEQYARETDGQSITGALRSYGYDSLGRLTSDVVTSAGSGATVTGTTYGYDLDDRLVGKTGEGTAGAAEHSYGYDLTGRMTSWTSGGATVPYTWDKAGNLTRRGDITGAYDARNRLETWGEETHTYTARGTTESVVTSENDVRRVESDAFERTVSNGTATLTYDSLDRVLTYGGTAFTYDGTSHDLVSDATNLYSRTPHGSLLAAAQAGPGAAQLVVSDQHGDVVAGLTPDGTSVAASRAYDPFGKVTATEGDNPAVGFQSGWTDPGTGEVHMAARWYQPETGGFTSRDTWQLHPDPSARANRYAYGEGEPLNGTDPTGHAVDPRGGGGGAPGGGGRGGGAGSGGGGGSTGRAPKPTRVSGTRTGSRASNQECSKYSSRCRVNVRGTKPGTKASNQECSKYTSRCRVKTTQTNRKPKGCAYYGTCRSTKAPSRNRGNNSGGTVRTGSGSRGKQTTTRGSGSGRKTGSGGTKTTRRPTSTRPPAPKVPQNTNQGKFPRPAPSRPQPKPQIDTAGLRQQSLQNTRHLGAVLDRMVVEASDPLVPVDVDGLEELELMFPDETIDTDQGHGGSGYAGSRKRVRQSCTLDFPSTDPGFYYAPMTRFGPDPGDCRATGAVATIDEFDLRPFRLDPKWDPAGFRSLPLLNRARLHLIGNQMGGANDTMRNFVAGYQDPANSPQMRDLENDIVGAVRDGESVRYGVLPVYGGSNPAIPTQIEMYAVGDGGYVLDCTVYNRPTGGVSCRQRSSGGRLSIP
ncbi:LamG-like jellyroll fold domain-containing protein [Streptomyces sp. NPDC058052]|uniref:LamG-like jellyroll fold domain-containing protein n=1 Tax=Streptomyces sp. NPDC058052 TaxID=3346316 RepID=UPI0036E1112A